MIPEDRLVALGLQLPEVAAPVAAYVPAIRTGVYVYTLGQIPLVDGALAESGKVGADVSAERAQELAAVCALNALAAVRAVVGSFDQVVRVVKVVGFVVLDPSFGGQSGVVNGVSDLFV